MRKVSAHVKVSWKVYGVLDTAENRICLPSALAIGHTLQRLSAHCTRPESSLGMGMGILDLLGDVELLEVLLSPRNLQWLGSSGNRAGVG